MNGYCIRRKTGEKSCLNIHNFRLRLVYLDAGNGKPPHTIAFNNRLRARIIAHMNQMRRSCALCSALAFFALLSALQFAACLPERPSGDEAGDPVLKEREERNRELRRVPSLRCPQKTRLVSRVWITFRSIPLCVSA